ncbi:MAG: RAD55 family ATPase [Halobacteria archaeon]
MSDGKTYEVGDVLPVPGFESGTNVLVSGPAGSGKTTLAARLLASGAHADEGALAITTDGNAADILGIYRQDSEEDVLHIVDCSGSGVGPPPDFQSDRFQSVGSPGDMTGVGVAFEKYSKRIGESVDGTRVMYDSLTTLLQYVDEKRAYRFVDVLTGRFKAEGDLSVFTVDGGTIDEQTSRMFLHEFDVEVSLRVEDGVREASIRGHPDAPDGWTGI